MNQTPPYVPAEHLMPAAWTLEQVAHRYDMSLVELERDAREGRIPHFKRGRKRYMTAAHIQAMFDANTVVGTEPTDPEAETRARVTGIRRTRRKADAA